MVTPIRDNVNQTWIQPPDVSYLVRIWPGNDLLNGGWHASLEDPSTQRMIHFSTLEELFEYFRLIVGEEKNEEINKN